MIKTTVVIKSWRPEAIKEAALKAQVGRMQQAVFFLQGQVKRAINRGNPRGTNPSKPGEPPKKVTSRLFQSITTDVKRMGDVVLGFVGSNVDYAKHLEFGTSKMEARPFFRPTLHKNLARIAKILGASK